MSSPTGERWTVGNEHNQVVGADLASAAAITPTHKVHFITGTAEITTINKPWANFSGELILIAEGAFTVATGGNCAAAITAVANKAYLFVYHPAKGLWYSQAIA